jgi:G3E family GTPase
MTKIDIFSGFLGAGKTTLIKKLIAEAYSGEKLVLIENEFGEINIDGGFLKESGIEISEMSAGCICCSLVGDFNKALKEVVAQFHPDRILIEPSGVGKLSDVIVAVERTVDECPGELKLNSYVTVADASKVKVYMKNFGEFYNNQIEAAGTIILSRTQKLSQEKLEAAAAAVCAMGLAGEIAHARLSAQDGNSTYRNYIIDAIYNMTPEQLEEGAKYEVR